MKKIKVSYLGLNSLFGRITTKLLKQSPCIHKLTLYDDGTPPHAIEHPNVFFGKDSLQDAVKDVNIVVIGDEDGEVHEEGRLRVIGPKVIRYTEAIIKFSPNAVVIVAASPMNILFPLIGNFLGPDWQDRLLGTTSVDTLRASRALDGLVNDPHGQAHILPVIGGTSYSTRVPLFSHTCPQITVSADIRDQIIEKMRLFDNSDSQEMDAIERAYSTVRFIHSVLTGMTRNTSVPEIAMTKTSGIPQTNYFSLPILIGRKGIERAADLPKLDEAEEKLFLEAALKLSEESQKAAVLGKQFCDQNEAEDLKTKTLIKLQNTNFHEVEGKKLASELQLKKTYKDPVPYLFRGGRSKKKQNPSRKNSLGLPCAEKASKSLGIINKSYAGHQKGPRCSSEAEANVLEADPTSEYSEILNKEVNDHLISLNFAPEGIQKKPNLSDENTDDDFTETLRFEVEEHLNSLKHGTQPRVLDCQSKNVATMVPGVDAAGRNELESWSAPGQVVSSSESNKLDDPGSAETPRITPNIATTPFKRTDSAIVDSKPVKFRSKSAKSTERTAVPWKSPSEKIDGAIADSRARPPENDSKIGLDLTNLEDRDAKKELRPGSVEKSVSDLLAGINPDAEKRVPAEALNLEPELKVDVKRELRVPDAAAHKIGSKSHIENLAVSDKKELRPRDHPTDSSKIKTENVNVGAAADAKKELRPRGTGSPGVDQNVSLATDDAKKELRPRGDAADESDLPKSYQTVQKRAGTEVRASKIRGKVNSQVLNAFEADRSSGDRMSKSQIMMLKRKQKTEANAGNDKPADGVGEDGDAAKAEDLQEVNSETNSVEVAPVQESVTESSTAKIRGAGRIGRRAVPLRRSSDKRKHRGKNNMVFTEGKWKALEEDDEATKESDGRPGPAETTSESVKIVTNVSTNTAKRINTAIINMKVRTPKKRTEGWNSPHYDRQPSKFSDQTHDAVPNNAPAAVTSKRIDGAITDGKTQTRRRSPSPKPVDFKPSHKQPDVSSHLLTDAARVAKLNSLHKTSSEEFNIEKTAENSNVRFEPDFKMDVNKKLQRENKKRVSKLPTMKPKSRKSDQTTTTRNMAEETEDKEDLTGNTKDKDLTSDKTMNYFMRQRKKGPTDLNNLESAEVPTAERPKHKKRQSGRKEVKSDRRKKHRHPGDHEDKNTRNASEIEQNSAHGLNHSKRSNQSDKVTPRKGNMKQENNQEPDDPWDSKYFTKASEMFFKMFRDTVTTTPPKVSDGRDPSKFNSRQTYDVFLGQSQKHPVEMKANPFQNEQTQNDTCAHSARTMDSQTLNLKNTSESIKSTDSSTSCTTQNLEASKNGRIHRKTSPGKISIKFDKPLALKCKMHPEASTKTSDMCGNLTFHVKTRNPRTNCKVSPKEEDVPKRTNNESIVSFDKLYEESSNLPIIIGAKGEKSWRSVGTGEKAPQKYVTSEVLHGVVATSDKGRGDALNKVDFRVCKTQDQSTFGTDARMTGETSMSKNGRSESSRGLNAAPMKIPIMSKTIKQVSTPYQMEAVQNKADVTQKPDRSYKWERIVDIFKNIIISDIEGNRPRFLLENLPTVPNISTSNIAKPVPPPPKNSQVAPQDAKRGVFKVKSKSEQAKKRKYETAKKKRPESKKCHVIKNNPKKIVNYFSKRGASASSYDKPRFDGCHDRSEGLMSQTSANMGQNSASFALPSKIK